MRLKVAFSFPRLFALIRRTLLPVVSRLGRGLDTSVPAAAVDVFSEVLTEPTALNVDPNQGSMDVSVHRNNVGGASALSGCLAVARSGSGNRQRVEWRSRSELFPQQTSRLPSRKEWS